MKRSECSVKSLQEIGFRQVQESQEPTIKDVAFGLRTGLYDCKVEDETQKFMQEGYEGDSPYHMVLTRRYYHRQYLYVKVRELKDAPWEKVLVRDILDGVWTSNYCGD